MTKPSETSKLSIKEAITAKKEKRKTQQRESRRKQIEQRRSETPVQRKEYSKSREAERKRLDREQKQQKAMKLKNAEYARRWRLKNKNMSTVADYEITKFPNRMSRSRAIRKLKASLPRTPSKRAATLAAYLKDSKSPAVKSLTKAKLIASPEDLKDMIMADSIVKDITASLDSKKKKRSDDFRTEVNAVMSSVCGDAVASNRCKVRLARKFAIPTRTVTKGHRLRTHVSHTSSSCFKYTERKTRQTNISSEHKKIMYDFWISPDISHPTGNKNDVKRVRIGVKAYSSHPVYILRKTQTEAFLDFKESHPNIRVSQSTFERCKPYFIREARKKDRVTCCCRYHLETRSLYKTCMDFRKKNIPHEECKVYDTLHEMCLDTLCEADENGHFNKACLSRECPRCGIQDGFFHPKELESGVDAPFVKWEAYEYREVTTKRGVCKKQVLIQKCTKPADMFLYLKKLLITFPAHNFRAKWQHSQFTTLLENLPQNHCITVHDYSENYKCNDKIEIQSSYFQKTEVSIHVSLVYRHAILEIDGFSSTTESPEIVCEHFFVISPDEKHDNCFTTEVQRKISDYLHSIAYTVNVMHEFCDGCAAQYKSRNCYGDLTNMIKSLGYNTIIRNFYETSHSKGPQDAAGGFVKLQADLAVLRNKAKIQNSEDFYQFATGNLEQTKSTKTKRRIFRHLMEVDRKNKVNYKPIIGIRATHQVVVHNIPNPELHTRGLSCYACEDCILGQTNGCLFDKVIGKAQMVVPKTIKTTRARRNSVKENFVFTESSDKGPSPEDFCKSEFIKENTVFAVWTDDIESEYYLLKAEAVPYTLDNETTDAWSTTWQQGTSVVRGKYFQNTPTDPLKYTLIKEHVALVPTTSVLFLIDTNFTRKTFKLSEDDHHKILQIREENQL